jgi:2-polyprenyl-3-methyl-5-hydroxy-6-metoxy-1,4-benzoquinol methylase
MDDAVKSAQIRFVSILKRLKQNLNDDILKLEAFDLYVKNILESEEAMLKVFNSGLHSIRYVMGSIKGKVLLDGGCGAGTFAVILSLLGAKKVYAVDFLPDCVELTNYIVTIAEIDNIEVIQSDISELDLPQASVDGIFSNEAISHYRNYRTFFSMAARTLNEGGFLAVSDSNNKASKSIRNYTQSIWDVYEDSPTGTTVPDHAKGELCYKDMRKAIIEKEFPNLSEDDTEIYARDTFAYSKEKIIQTIKEFMQGDFSGRSQYAKGKCPLDPETDCYNEQLFDPRELKHELVKYGFKTRIRSLGPARPDLKPISYLWEWLSPITIYMPRAFQIVSKKPVTSSLS